ncbi:MAG: type II secretion system F family protein [Bdellovibrionota bacterium]
MSLTLTIIIVVLIAALVLGMLMLTMGSGSGVKRNAAVNNNLRTLVHSQRQSGRPGDNTPRGPKSNLALAAAAESKLSQKKSGSSGRLTLDKRLRYARWPITPVQFRAIQGFATLFLFVFVYLHTTIFLQLLVLLLTPLLVGSALDYAINKRFEAFDKDYPVLLLSYVSLLKTGMNAIQGMEAAAKGLDPDSLVRAEVELLVERLRLGLTEEQAISAFGEDVAHPELELFVQSLILSRRVGGTLSQTLERLAKQVRKRQQFRKQAVAVVGMERSSLYMIAVIMGLLLGYLVITSPQLVLPAFSHPLGNKIFQCGIMLIVFGFYWSRKVTNIKI